MQMKFKGLVREIFVADKDKKGDPKKPVHYITFMDADTGGDVKLAFDEGHGLKVGSGVIELDLVVRGRLFGNSVGYHVEQSSAVKPK